MLSSIFYDPLGALLDILYRLPAVFIAFSVHEFMHALAAVRLGDETPRRDGRLTLNPSSHIDWVGVIMLLLFGFGWAKPVRVTPSAFRSPKRDSVLVSLAGVTGNIILSFVFFAAYILLAPLWSGEGIAAVLSGFISALYSVNLMLAIFNLLPIPPLDGYAVLKTLAARNITNWWNFERYGFVILILLSFTGVLGYIMSFISGWVITGFFVVINGIRGFF